MTMGLCTPTGSGCAGLVSATCPLWPHPLFFQPTPICRRVQSADRQHRQKQNCIFQRVQSAGAAHATARPGWSPAVGVFRLRLIRPCARCTVATSTFTMCVAYDRIIDGRGRGRSSLALFNISALEVFAADLAHTACPSSRIRHPRHYINKSLMQWASVDGHTSVPTTVPTYSSSLSALFASAVVAVVDRLELALPRLVEQGLHMLAAHADVDRLINPHADALAEQLFGANRRPVLAIGLGLVTDLIQAALHALRRDALRFVARTRTSPLTSI